MTDEHHASGRKRLLANAQDRRDHRVVDRVANQKVLLYQSHGIRESWCSKVGGLLLDRAEVTPIEEEEPPASIFASTSVNDLRRVAIAKCVDSSDLGTFAAFGRSTLNISAVSIGSPLSVARVIATAPSSARLWISAVTGSMAHGAGMAQIVGCSGLPYRHARTHRRYSNHRRYRRVRSYNPTTSAELGGKR